VSVTTDIRRVTTLMVMVASILAGPMALAASTGSAAAQQLVMEVTSSIVEELTSRRESLRNDPQGVHDLVDRLVLPHFDFERMSRRALGKRWKEMPPEQRRRFVSAFRSMLVRTYATMLDQYRGQTLTWLDPVARKKDDEIVIPVQINLSASQPARVAYLMHGNGTDWKVFDVAVDGVSLIRNYRSSFRSEIARHGIDGLIDRLEARNAKTD